MNWDAIGAIAELLGAIGVIGSLVYVAFQVRSSTLASRVESKLRMAEYMVRYGDMLLDKPELNALIQKGRNNYKELSKEEFSSFANLCIKACWYFSAGFFMYQQKSISEDDWYETKMIVVYWVSSKGFQQWWESRGYSGFGKPFRAFIEAEIAKVNNSAGSSSKSP